MRAEAGSQCEPPPDNTNPRTGPNESENSPQDEAGQRSGTLKYLPMRIHYVIEKLNTDEGNPDVLAE